MQITSEPREQYTILHLHGEFDTFGCPRFLDEVERFVRGGGGHVAVDLRLVKFINSTALSAILDATRLVEEAQGRLAITRPSRFCREILERVGLARAVPIYDSHEAARKGLLEGSWGSERGEEPAELPGDDTAVLFTPCDAERVRKVIPEARRIAPRDPRYHHRLGENWRGVGHMLHVDDRGMRFEWNGGKNRLSVFEMGQLLAVGTELDVKFRLPLFRRGYHEARVAVNEILELSDGIELAAGFRSIDPETLQAVKQYRADILSIERELGGDGEDGESRRSA